MRFPNLFGVCHITIIDPGFHKTRCLYGVLPKVDSCSCLLFLLPCVPSCQVLLGLDT